MCTSVEAPALSSFFFSSMEGKVRGVEVREEGKLVSQRFTRFSICGDIPGRLLAVCVRELCIDKAQIHVENSFFSLPPNTYASVEMRPCIPNDYVPVKEKERTGEEERKRRA